MDDPWGSPWAADTATKLDIPSDQRQNSDIAASVNGQSPRKLSADPTSPWGNAGEDDDAWGGWNDGTTANDSPGWGRSPNFQPLGDGASGNASLDPWGELDIGATKATEEFHSETNKSIEEPNLTALDEGDIQQILDHDELADTVVGDQNDVNIDDQSSETSIECSSKLNDEPTQEPAISPEQETKTDAAGEDALLDEQRPEASRQLSKVLELVEMYDGMAKQSSSSLELPINTTKTTLNEEDTTAEPDSRGTNPAIEEDENGSSERDVEESEVLEATLPVQSAETTSDTTPQSRPSGDQTPQRDSDKTHEIPKDEESSPKQRKTSPVSYAIDLSDLDALFPGTQHSTTEPEVIPDRIPSDTFTSVAERKAWYRISRFGSIRKHNDGDDESYVRVSWNNSTIRHDTLTIVRRWMEEDSMGGRVVLGRRLGHGGASMFNWDSSAPQVEIGELLAQKKHKKRGHTRQASETVQGTVMSPTAAAFSWSTSVPSSPLTSRRPPSSEWNGKSLPDGGVSAVSEEPDPPLSAKSVGLSGIDPPTETAQETIKEEHESEDDDWGEMISSPTIDVSNSTSIDSVLDTAPTSVSGGWHAEEKEQKEVTAGLNISVVESDPWAGFDSFEKNTNTAGELSQVQPPLATLEPTSPVELPMSKAPESTEMVASVPEQVSDCVPSQKSDNVITASNETVLPPTVSSTDSEVVTEILRGLPDLSYMLQ